MSDGFVVCPTPASEIKGREGEKPGDKILLNNGPREVECVTVTVNEVEELTAIQCVGGWPTVEIKPESLVLRVVDSPASEDDMLRVIQAAEACIEDGPCCTAREAEETCDRVRRAWRLPEAER